jgi:hypothetical protein
MPILISTGLLAATGFAHFSISYVPTLVVEKSPKERTAIMDS